MRRWLTPRRVVRDARSVLSLLQPRALALGVFRCPLCRGRLLVRLQHSEIGVRCVGCGASAITLSLAHVLLALRPGFRHERVYELSARGPLYEYLRREVRDLTCSEYLDGVPPGAWRGDVQCQDVQHLTHPDTSFDLVTCTEVFEHVAHDRKGFAEVRRVLRPGGTFLFTVPLAAAAHTVERAEPRGHEVRHMLPPVEHGDPARGRILVFRDYGQDVVERLLQAGFAAACIDVRCERAFLGAGRGVVVAHVAGERA